MKYVLLPYNQNPYGHQPPPYYPPAPSDNRKIYSILAYIPLLWLFGLCVEPEKHDPAVRFHVGQGIILNLIWVAFSIVATIITSILVAIETPSFNIYTLSYHYAVAGAIGLILHLLLLGGGITFMVLGILNATRYQCKYLPMIGRLSFYK